MATPAMVSPTSPSWVQSAPALTGPGAVGGGAVGGGGAGAVVGVALLVDVLVDVLVDGEGCDAAFVLEPQALMSITSATPAAANAAC